MRNFKKIKIAIVAPPFGNTGGPEVVVKNLTDALLKKGIDVTLFAPGDWKTKAKLVPTLKKSLWNIKNFTSQKPKARRNLIILSQIRVLLYQKKFDIIHLHSQSFAYVVAKLSNIPVVISFHNKILQSQYEQLREAKASIVSLSKFQKGNKKTVATIWNGVPISNIKYSEKKGKYLIFVGRLADQKGVDTAIQVAIKTKKKLLIFGRVGNSAERQNYYKKKILPFLDGRKVIHMKEVSNKKIYDYFRNAEATLFTIRRPEVCPMVIAESLACGTPVIGTRVDPLPELIGNNDKICILSNNIKELIKAAKNTAQFDRTECRKYAERNFNSSIMADKYILLYRKILRI